jgi:amino acid adenylation domain-containing protein
MLQDARAALVVSEPRFEGVFDLPMLEVAGDEVWRAASSRPAHGAVATDACYAIYTSGSTGKPKGVELTHRAVLNTLEWVNRTFAVKPGDRALFVTSACFDLSVYDVFGVLAAGATVVIASAASLAEPRALVKLLIDGGITIWDSAPAALQRLVPFLPAHGGRALRLVLLSGDWIPLSLPGALRQVFPAAQVTSLGGATEAAIWSNWFDIGALDPAWVSIPYGRPIQNARYYVLDARREPVPRGVPGDLYIAGACLARGYLHRPELTAERFVPDPFVPGERMYATGDRARHFEDGVLEFLGRADFQVKVRGFRVELGELEAALGALKGVLAAVATTFVDATGTRALVAYVVPKEGAVLEQDAVRRQLGATLPEFLVPSRVLVLPALPLSPNGKVDRNALPAPQWQGPASSGYLAPRSDAERQLVALWEEVLQRRPIGVTDDFFALGGDSLLALVLICRIEAALKLELPLSRILEAPTIERLAATLQKRAARGRHLVSLSREGERAPLVLVSGAGGFGFCFRGLAAQLGSRQPLHVLQAVGAEDDGEGQSHTVEELASIYEPQVLAACPEGPLVLGGYSFGALVGFELARRLVARGREVPLLISFDGMAPGNPVRLRLPERLLLHLDELVGRGPEGRRAYLRGRLKRFKRRLPLKFETHADVGPAAQQRLHRLAKALILARAGYAPKATIRSSLLLLKATEPEVWPGCKTDEVYGWGAFIRGRIDTALVPGSHLSLFSPQNDEFIARAVEAHLDRLPRG